MHEILAYLRNHEPRILKDIERLVRIESPSNNTSAINRAQELNAEWLEPLGTVDRHPGDRGDVLHVRIAGRSSNRPVLLGHVDTLYPLGTWREVWRVDGDKALGPGAPESAPGSAGSSDLRDGP